MTQRIKRWIMPLMATMIVVLGMSAGASAQPGGLPGWGSGGMDEMKAGPLGLNMTPSTGQLPVQMLIADADVDAEVEVRTVVEGAMQDPTGPWVISWYDTSKFAGAMGNSVYSGHVDYWGVGPSVLRNVAALAEGAEINVIGQDGTTYTYGVEYIERITVAELTPDDLENIVGDTDYQALTIITCGGEFNYDSGEYEQRDVVRARLISTTPAGGEAVAETDDAATGEEVAPSGELVSGGTATATENGVNVRSEPSTAGDVVTTLASGESVTITGDAQDGDGYTWWPVETGDGSTGWVVADFLLP